MTTLELTTVSYTVSPITPFVMHVKQTSLLSLKPTGDRPLTISTQIRLSFQAPVDR